MEDKADRLLHTWRQVW